jgi:hypothetical protein
MPDAEVVDEHGVVVGGVAIGPVLEHWVRMMLEPWDANQDAPWWYNERATLSQLAGAIWLEGGWVFEEYAASKKVEGAVDRKRGRVDMMFEWKSVKAVAEAKQIWPSLETRHGFIAHIKRCLAIAQKDAGRAPNVANRYERLGVVFVAPVVPPRMVQSPDRFVAALKGFVDELRAVENVSVAWAFPADRRRMRSKTKKYVYPGVALAIGRVV